MSLLETGPRIMAHTDYAHEDEWAEPHPAMDIFFPELKKCNALFENCKDRLGPKNLVPVLKKTTPIP